ncbi:hypothetical protein D3C76_1121770 [compost metagenome]
MSACASPFSGLNSRRLASLSLALSEPVMVTTRLPSFSMAALYCSTLSRLRAKITPCLPSRAFTSSTACATLALSGWLLMMRLTADALRIPTDFCRPAAMPWCSLSGTPSNEPGEMAFRAATSTLPARCAKRALARF